nr:MAG TPA: hypothetical protein [Caudoviricetes sp.]
MERAALKFNNAEGKPQNVSLNRSASARQLVCWSPLIIYVYIL